METNQSKFKKRRIIFIMIIIPVIILLVIIGINLDPTQNNYPNNSENVSSNIISRDINSFLPTREEIPTEFQIDSNSNGTISLSKVLGIYGATESIETIIISISNFSSEEEAQNQYSSQVNSIKSAGGYSSLSIPSKSTCFAYTEDYGLSAKLATILCYNKNILFSIEGQTDNSLKSSNNDVKIMLSIIDGKIK